MCALPDAAYSQANLYFRATEVLIIHKLEIYVKPIRLLVKYIIFFLRCIMLWSHHRKDKQDANCVS
jgi:hypothetical protein